MTNHLQPILNAYQDVFSSVPATTSLGVHQIMTPEDQVPIALRPRRTPLAATDTLEKELDSMLEMGIIRPSTSPWNSPVVVVPKKDGTLRFCIDFRGLNKVTQRDPYGMPSVDELRDRITGAKYFSNIDLTKCYWQLLWTLKTSRRRLLQQDAATGSLSKCRLVSAMRQQHASAGLMPVFEAYRSS
jgi:hypothetical protein